MAVHETGPENGTIPWLSEQQMSESSTGIGKVVVNRSMSLDGFIAGPGHTMDWAAVVAGSRTSWRRTMLRKSRRPPAPC